MTETTSELKMWLTHVRLKVTNLDKMAHFYQKHFGMTILDKQTDTNLSEDTYFLGYHQEEEEKPSYNLNKALLELTYSSPSSSHGHCRKNNEDKYSVYWKIGVNVYDLRLAVEGLKEAEVEMSEPLDIPEVGLLCHVFDPDGYDTELMQFTFQSEMLKYEVNQSYTIGQKGTFSVITIRARDIEKSTWFYQDILGMKLLCKQDQSKDYGFDVYYFGFTNEIPPNPDNPNDVINREWTYQRPYTLLELEVYTRGPSSQPFHTVMAGQCGFTGIGMACNDVKWLVSLLRQHKYEHYMDEVYSDMFQTKTVTVYDPDFIPIRFIQIN